MMSSPHQGQYAFSVFRFDSRTGELYRNGYRLRITEQVRQVLAVLLENAGCIITREQLRQQLWPDGQYVDWDSAINNLIAQLRSTLRDSARKKQFIETVPRRGYCFIAPISFEPESTTSQSVASEQEQGKLTAPIDAEVSQSQSESIELPQPDSTSQDLSAVAVGGSGTTPQAQRRPLFPRRVFAIAVITLLLVALTTLTALHLAKRRSASYINLGIPAFEVSGEASDALAESFRLELISAVAEVPRVQVRGAHSLTAPLRDDQSIRATAKSLNLDLLLFGRLTCNGEQRVLQLEVVRAADAVHLATFRYSGSSQEFGKIRDKIQRDLFAQLGLAGPEGNWRTQSATPNANAYEAYLQARLDLSGWTDAPVQKGLEGFQKAIDEDQNFANAYAGLASTYVVQAEHGTAPRELSYRKAQEAAAKAVQLAPSIAEAHAVLGKVALEQDWNFEVAERELRRAVELDPNRALYHLWLSVLLSDQSRFKEALSEIDLARAADPFWAPVYGTEGGVAAYAGQFARGIEAAEKMTALMPNWPRSYDQRGWAYWYAGRYADAIADWQRMANMENDTARTQLEDEGLKAFRRGGVSAYSRLRLTAIQSGYPYRHADTDFVPVEWYCIAGEDDRALAEIEKMVARHDRAALELTAMPSLQRLHNNARFGAALMRLGLNQPKPQVSTQITGSSTLHRDVEVKKPTFE